MSKQQTGGHKDRTERVTEIVPENADEHLPELRHRTELALALLGARLGRVGLDCQPLRGWGSFLRSSQPTEA